MSSEQTENTKEGASERNIPSPDQKRRGLEEEFNVQRAKMKELFLQKEEDMRKMINDKEQLESEVLSLRAELQQLQTLSENQKSELQNLQLLVSETVEASSSGNEEVKRLKTRNLELEQQINQLRQQQQEVSLAPATLVRTIARKLGAEAEMEQPVKKNIEGNELMLSLVKALEMEIGALKEKLRKTDEQLQEALEENATLPAAVASGQTPPGGDVRTEPEGSRSCDMCANYEKQLVSEQAEAEAARDRVTALDLALKQATAELEGVRSLHEETVRAWQGSRAATALQAQALQGAVARAQHELAERAEHADAAARRALDRVTLLTVDRETLQLRLDTLERDNNMLLGRYIKKAQEIQNEIIDLPDMVEELQEHVLLLREQLIFSQIGQEESSAAETELRAQLLERGLFIHQQEAALASVRTELRHAREQLDALQTEREQMSELGDKLRHSSDMIERLLEDKKRLQTEVYEIRSRVAVLQQELDNSEKVQQDFVRLSQSLQVQLQRIREADTEVRWQHEEDVCECPTCRAPLHNNKKKVHCRHCGRIFCGACVSQTVPSGPRRVPARVCTVCCTLLQPHAAPYFSTDPPRSPD